MSVDVSLVVIEKERNLPWATFWLGGNGVRDELEGGVLEPDFIQTIDNVRYYLVSSEQARDVLSAGIFNDYFYAGHYADEALSFLDGISADDYALYVEIA